MSGPETTQSTAPAEHGPNVLITDDRPVLRAGLRSVLDDMRIVGDCEIARCPAEVVAHAPDVLVAGLREDDPSTFHAAARAKGSNDRLRVMVVADGATVIELREAVIAGVDSFLLTSASEGELRDATLRTARGERIISPTIAAQLGSGWREEPQEQGVAHLTPRELEVLQLLAEGLTNQQVGTQLELSPRTVKTHVQNLLVKLDSPDRTGAVARGFRLGLIR